MRASRRARLAAALAVLAASCSLVEPGPGADPESSGVIDVYGPYTGADADRFAELVAPFEQQSGYTVRYVGSANFTARLAQRAAEGRAPDVAILPQPGMLDLLAPTLAPLPPDAEAEVRATWYPDLVELSEVDGTLYGVWLRLAVKSLVWFPPKVFEERGYEVPLTYSDMEQLDRQIQADGTAPWCLAMESFGATGWVGTDWVEDLVLRLHGVEVYDGWVAGEIAFTDERIAEAFTVFGDLATNPRLVLGGTRRVLGVPVTSAQDPMFDDEPGCLLHRQASSYRNFLPSGTIVGPDGDTDVFLLPAMDDEIGAPVLIGGEMVTAFSADAAVVAFMTWLTGPDVGSQWAEAGGFISPHPDFLPDDPSEDELAAAYPGAIERRSADFLEEAAAPGGAGFRFDGSDQMPPEVGSATFWEGITAYVGGAPLDQALEFIESGYDDVGNRPLLVED